MRIERGAGDGSGFSDAQYENSGAQILPGAVIVDVAIDQGGCFETSRPTTHDAPTFVEEGIIHHCVTDMPGAVPRTSTLALTNATLPFVRQVAAQGWEKACTKNASLKRGLNIVAGEILHPGILEAFA